MTNKPNKISSDQLPSFDRKFFDHHEAATCIGSGFIGGKASGLVRMESTVSEHFPDGAIDRMTVRIPRFTTIATDVFDCFMQRNDLHDIAMSDAADDVIAHAFQKAELPAEIVGDLMALSQTIHTPLAIRSSSLLEDAMYEPFAGVYETKMIPNNQTSAESRFQVLVEAIKFVYASVYFKSARQYMKALGKSTTEEKMAVIIQEVIGRRFDDRFYPHFSGVARSYNFYPMGRAGAEDGVVELALGLGKTIVGGGLAWSYSPAYPRLMPVVGSMAELLKKTQTNFWAVNMGEPPEYNPIAESEYLIPDRLDRAEYDGALRYLASTYRPQDDRLVTGTGPDGPRVVTFAPILADNVLPLNQLVKSLLALCEAEIGSEVEIEFAVTLETRPELTARLGFLQMRPMAVSKETVTISSEESTGEQVLAVSDKALGNGVNGDIKDVVYVMPDSFDAKHTRTVARELEMANQRLTDAGRKYLLIGYGRWGSSDPWLGIPVVWSQISGAGAIIEATLPTMNVELSQGSHFFHNLTSFKICYIMVKHTASPAIDWQWLQDQKEESRARFVRHVCLDKPLTIKVDGRTGRGVILK